MWKYILALTILTHCVQCRIFRGDNGRRVFVDERQWAEADAREHCIETCHDDCVYCEEPTHCTVDEDKCGEKAPKIHPNCSPNDICVPAGCECETTGTDGEPCTLICPPDCNDEEIQCPGCDGNCPNGCKENDYCHPKGQDNDGNTCPGFCPFQCGDDEITCPEPNCTPAGCECPPLCILKQNDNHGNVCPDQQCPLICDVTEILCVGSRNHQGCKEDDVCIAKDISNTGELCPGNCPVTCENSEIKCDGVVVWINGTTDGCVGPHECKAKAKDVNMEYCEDDSHSHDCPISCPPWEIFCPPETTILGCLEMAHCTPRSKDNDGNFCADIIDCPPPCKPGEVPCPHPDGDYENGCKRPDLCIQQERDFEGELCSVECPINCAENEILCPGQRDEVGCLDAPVCVVRERKDRGDDIGALCPGFCPANCLRDEVLCPSQVDPCDGCPTEELCVDAQKDLNDIFCPGQNYPNEPLSASHNCPILCDDLAGYVLCPAHENENGCKLEAECRLRQIDSDNQWCPGHSVCPLQCNNDEILCHFGTDSRGCTYKDLCLGTGNDKDGIPCLRSCPPKCSGTEVFCPGSALPNGCAGGGTCIERGFDVHGIICPAVCPPSCEEGELIQPGGTNGHGCPLPSTCIGGSSELEVNNPQSDLAVLKKLDESCGDCLCPPTYTAGECEPHLECVTNPWIPDLPGTCMTPLFCCEAMTADCLACKERMELDEFCRFNENVIGCEVYYEQCGIHKCWQGEQCCSKDCNEYGELIPDKCLQGTECPIPVCEVAPGPLCGETQCSFWEECCMTCDEQGQQVPNNECASTLNGLPGCPVVDCIPPGDKCGDTECPFYQECCPTCDGPEMIESCVDLPPGAIECPLLDSCEYNVPVCFMPNVEYSGNNCGNPFEATSINECYAAYVEKNKKTPSCGHFTYRAFVSGTGTCLIKSTKGNSNPNQEAVSGPVSCDKAGSVPMGV